MSGITNMADIVDVRDIIARVEELEIEVDNENISGLDASELEGLRELLSELEGNGGYEQWRGNWYPLTLIRDSYFQDYAQELAEEIDAMPKNAQWPCTCIDWKKAAQELRTDYSSIEYNGVTYWYR